MNRIGLIMYRAEKETKVSKLIHEEIENKDLFKKTTHWFQHVFPLKDGWRLRAIKDDAFLDYSYFDNFLLSISKKTFEDKKIIVLGHNDKDGWFWTDY